jgi:hypothetical protein
MYIFVLSEKKFMYEIHWLLPVKSRFTKKWDPRQIMRREKEMFALR